MPGSQLVPPVVPNLPGMALREAGGSLWASGLPLSSSTRGSFEAQHAGAINRITDRPLLLAWQEVQLRRGDQRLELQGLEQGVTYPVSLVAFKGDRRSRSISTTLSTGDEILASTWQCRRDGQWRGWGRAVLQEFWVSFGLGPWKPSYGFQRNPPHSGDSKDERERESCFVGALDRGRQWYKLGLTMSLQSLTRAE